MINIRNNLKQAIPITHEGAFITELAPQAVTPVPDDAWLVFAERSMVKTMLEKGSIEELGDARGVVVPTAVPDTPDSTVGRPSRPFDG